MRGITTIELTDVNTGEKEVHEDHNLVTNAVASVLNGYLKNAHALPSTMLPLNTKGMGGIMLFDTAKTADPANIFDWDNMTDLVGYANQSAYSGADTKRGGLNANESGPITGGYKFVYDFATSQANGVVACIGLTNQNAGAYGYAYLEGADNTTSYIATSGDFYNYGAFAIDYDFANNILTCMTQTSDTNLRVCKFKIGLSKFNLTENYNAVTLISTTDYTLSTATYANALYCKSGDYYYGIYQVGTTGYIWRLNSSFAIDTAWGIKSYATAQALNIYKNGSTSHSENCIIKDNNLVIAYNSYCYKVNLTNLSNVVAITLPYADSEIAMALLSDNIILAGNQYIDIANAVSCKASQRSYPWLDTSDSTKWRSLFCKDGLAIATVYRNYGNILCLKSTYLNPYLATINNLQTAVTKTADKTMKITYTLTYE